jgi:multidrug efflux pump subunit AcrA (membrane-fusion protein)
LKWLLAAWLLAMAGMAPAGIYKWVDAKGVTHYAESSPKNVPAAEVEIEPPPSYESMQESQQRLEDSMQDQAQRTRDYEAQKQQLRAAQLAREKAREQRLESCSHALVQLRILEETTPVYLDESGEYHTQTSVHSAGYRGKRVYLGDDERPLEIRRFKREIADNCDSGTAGRPQLDDLLRSYHQNQCKSARQMLVALEKARLKAHRNDIRDLRDDIEKHCHH